MQNKVFGRSIGLKLKEKREFLGLSLDKVENELRIKKETLTLIEKDEFEKIGPEVYVKGFLKNYAQFLNIDPSIVLSSFKRDFEKIVKKIFLLLY